MVVEETRQLLKVNILDKQSANHLSDVAGCHTVRLQATKLTNDAFTSNHCRLQRCLSASLCI